jgi:hypothetical protein
MRDELAVELKKANKTGNILHKLRNRPMLEELMLQDGRAIPIGGNVNPD